MFWVVMTVVASTVTVTYAVIGRYRERWGISAERTRRFRTSSWLAAGWTAVCAGHVLVGR